WRRGLDDCEGLLRYSLQLGPITAIQETLQNTPDVRLLSRIADWCSMPLYNWRAVYCQSAGIHEGPPRYDTPARAACAGFWHLHQGELANAADAFAAVRLLRHGEELHKNTQALAAAGNCQNLEQIAVWQSPALPQGASLRPQVRAAFDRLAEVAKDIDLVLHARSTRQRNSALNRASGRLHGFSAESADCPTPERPQLEKIAARWLDIILVSAGSVGSLEVREPVASPYIVGAPVPAVRLAGRQDIFARIEAAWAKSGPRDSLVIFGHRRMGKTSVARAVKHLCQLGDDTRLAFLNLQIVDWTEGLSDLCHAIAFALWEADPNGLDEPASEDYEQHPLATLRRMLSRLGQSTPPRRYILVLDEYELLEEKLPDAVAGDRTALLRGLTQQHTWLALGLVGLHSLQERSASLREAIFGWRPIPVSLMDRDAFADLLQIEEDAFPLEYGLDAIDRAYQLTGGQPFLGQLLSDSLVQRFNRQLKQQLEPPAPTFTAADVDAVVEDSRFYLNGHGYFNGIWAQAGEAPPGQQALLKILANHGDGLDRNAWRQTNNLDPATFDAALEALKNHDVVTDENGICRYSVELMRRWIAAQCPL
ncbi:MAG: ATP-binding protein, partial [Candidatus Contendobacter sp.]|nr:ATP-binding protein [Candidatus Contendobacter sp.]